MKYFLWSLLQVIRALEIWLENVDGEKDVKDIANDGSKNRPSNLGKGTGAYSTKVVDENSTGKSDCESGGGTTRPTSTSTKKGKGNQEPTLHGNDLLTDPLTGHSNIKTDAPAIIPLCPLCNNPMVYKRARKGGNFYGCSTWPLCRGSRNPHNKNPGPVKLVAEQKELYGLAFEEMERKILQGAVPFA